MAKSEKANDSQTLVKIHAIGSYNGHNIRANQSVDICFKFPYDELTNYLQLNQLLNNNVEIAAKIEDEKPMRLGTFMIKELKTDHDGEGMAKFNSLFDAVNADALNELVGTERIKILFKSLVELEDSEED